MRNNPQPLTHQALVALGLGMPRESDRLASTCRDLCRKAERAKAKAKALRAEAERMERQAARFDLESTRHYYRAANARAKEAGR